MAKDIEQELDAIFTHHKARVAQARNDATGKTAAEENFSQAATVCLASVITPALQQMAQALNQRGVAARVPTDGSDARIDIPVSRHARLGHGLGGYPYLRAKPDRQTRRIRFERNTSDSHGGSAVGDYTIAEINAELVKAMVVDLVRELYGPY
jgi:sirohydrochlorin ferrochelatase